MAKQYKTQILNGGYLLCRLNPHEIALRKYYFVDKGIFAKELGSNIQPRDSIEYCLETNEIIVTRENTTYCYINPGSSIDSLIQLMKKDEFKPTRSKET